MMRTTPKKRPPEPPREPPEDEQKRPGVKEKDCAVCGETFDRCPDDPPCCSQDCWVQLRSERPEEDPR